MNIKSSNKIVVLAILIFLPNLYGQAIISLAMPPGATGMAGAGASSSNNLNSLYYNPAILSKLYDYSGSRLHFLRYRSNLLPKATLGGLEQEFTAIGISTEKLFNFVNFGIGYFKNRISFGNMRTLDTSLAESYETVQALTFSIRLFDYISIGYNYKWVYSLLLPPNVLDSNGYDARVKTRDIGLLLSHKFELPLKGMYIEPSLGMMFLNTDDSVYYSDQDSKDPIPHQQWNSYTLRTGFQEYFEMGFTHDRQFDLLNDDHPHSDHFGFQIMATPFFVYSIGYLNDDPGKREETHSAWKIRLDLLRTLVFMKRIQALDFITPFAKLKTEVKIFKFKYQPNFVMEYSESSIDDDKGIRDDQKGFHMYLSI